MSTAVEGSSSTNSQPGQDWKSTFWYVGGAAACLAVTGAVQLATRPAAIEEYGKVGNVFYEEFVDPTLASSLEVYLFDADALRPVDFRVERLPNGRWVIPSHHNYPADAEEQLAKTASSTIGITRGAMVTRWPADHSQYGVVNPKQDSLAVDEVEGIGQRIILRKDDDSVLADYVIGKKVDESENEYYVRHPDEDEVYITKLEIDLSTRFTDWIETKLYEFSNGEILRLTTNNYSFNELNNVLTKRDITALEREKTWSDDWQMEDLDPAEEVNKDAIRETCNAIADLEVIGVRPKQKGLTPDLQLDQNAIKSNMDIAKLQQDLQSSGFLLQPGEEGGEELMLISREGELFAGTDDGLMYRMYFGRVFTGSQEELEIGFASGGSDDEQSSDDEQNAEEKETGEDSGADSDPSAGEPKSDGAKPGRYMFVRVELDKTLLGEEPTKPTEPQKSEELLAAEKAAEEETGDKADAEGANDTADAEADASGEDADAEGAEESELDRLRREFEEAETQYRDDQRAFEEYEEKVTKAQEKADELNRRFAEWYYVIPGESFDKLKLGRTDLVKAKETTEEEGESDTNDSVGILSADAEGSSAAANSAPAEESPAETSATDPADGPSPGAQPDDSTDSDGAADAPTESESAASDSVEEEAESAPNGEGAQLELEPAE